MGYIKIAYQDILNKIDRDNTIPKGWNEFVTKNAIPHNLIIKSSKNNCCCTNCKNTFISKYKVNEKVKCPHCNNKYLIKRSNLKYYEFKDYLSILNYVNNTFVIRYFELKTVIDAEHNHNSSVVEFAREMPSRNYYRDIFVNERVSKCQGCIHIYHFDNNYIHEDKWRQYTRNYSLIDYSIVFPNNIKGIMKNTEYKYSCIWDIAKHCSYIDLLKLIQNKSTLNQVELLTKMKLYNLALKADMFYGKGTFKEIFGVSKDNYKFMRRYNITYTQLKLLQLLKEPNINKIRYLERYVTYGDNINDLQEISEYISLNRFIKYSKICRRKVPTYLYKDYLRFAKLLGLDLKNNRYAFPKNLREEHDKLESQYEIQSKKLIQAAIVKRNKELLINKYKNKNYIILPAPTLKALQDESKQQNNCVRTYAEKYAQGTCDIYFMRDIKNQKKSLVTVEVKNNKVVQSRIKYNNSPNEKQLKFLHEWENNVLRKAA